MISNINKYFLLCVFIITLKIIANYITTHVKAYIFFIHLFTACFVSIYINFVKFKLFINQFTDFNS